MAQNNTEFRKKTALLQISTGTAKRFDMLDFQKIFKSGYDHTKHLLFLRNASCSGLEQIETHPKMFTTARKSAAYARQLKRRIKTIDSLLKQYGYEVL